MLTSHMQISAETEKAPAQRTVSVPAGRRAPDERVFNFTEDSVRKARPHGDRCWYWDSKVSGLGLEVRASGARCFVLRHGSNTRRKLAPEHQWPHTSIAAVRVAVRALLAELDKGKDPFNPIGKELGDLTLRDGLNVYLQDLRDRRVPAKTINRTEQMFTGNDCFKTLLDEPLWGIKRTTVRHLHKCLYREVRKRNGWEDAPAREGARTADEIISKLGAIIECNRQLIDDDEKRSANPIGVMKARKLWFANDKKLKINRNDSRAASDTELARIIDKLNNWDGNPVHRSIAMLSLLCGFRATLAASVAWSYVNGDWINFPAEVMRKSGRDFRFPVTSELRVVVEECHMHGSKLWLTPQADLDKHVNSDDWMERMLKGLEDPGTKKMGSHNMRDTMMTRVCELMDGNLTAASLLGDHKPEDASETTLRYVDPATMKQKAAAKYHAHLVEKGLRLQFRV